MPARKHAVAAEHLEAITGGAPPVIDLDEAHRGVIRSAAAEANANAVIAEIEADRIAKAIELLGGGDDAAQGLERAQRIAGERRRRATALMDRAGVTSAGDLALDMRLFVARQLAGLQATQVANEEKFGNLELYAVGDEEAASMRHPDAPPPETADLLRVRALEGRAAVAAHVDWLTAHAGDGPDLTDDVANPQRQAGVDALRRFLGVKAPDAAELETTAATERQAAKAAEDPALGKTS